MLNLQSRNGSQTTINDAIMMELQKIETLLLQEMEDVKGGRGGSCQCDSGTNLRIRYA